MQKKQYTQASIIRFVLYQTVDLQIKLVLLPCI